MSGVPCPVSLDLARYLAELEHDDAFHDACDQQIVDWRRDHAKITDVLVGFEENGESAALDQATVLTAHPDDRAAYALRFFLRLDGKVLRQLEADAPDAVRRSQESARNDDDGDGDARWAA